MTHKLTAEQLAWKCPETWLEWESLKEIDPATTIVGQQRAVEAIGFGLAMRGVGYNIFVTGLAGTGRLTTIKRFLDQLTNDQEPPKDVCFVFNFRKPEEPNALFLKASAGRRLRDGMEAMLRELVESIPGIFSDK
jgi:Cdc6-like AAA superfamily ATPase